MSQSHDDCEYYGAELGNGEEDKKLTDRGADRENHAIEQELWMLGRKLDSFGKSTLDEQRRSCEQSAEQVHARHHLKTRDSVGLENFTLPVGREGIEDHVKAEQEESGDGCDGRVLAVIVASTEEEDHADRYRRRHNIFIELIFIAGNYAAHNHDRDDFT